MKIVAISDTHSYHRQISMPPNADVLVCAGDITWKGELDIIEDFCNWMKELPYKHKVIVLGNHELGIQNSIKREPALEMIKNAGLHYLEDSSVEIDGVLFYGSPWTPYFYDWEWNLQRGPEIAEKWKKIPDETNVLITHGPPYGILDRTPSKENVGCKDLKKRVRELSQLKCHVYGHIHLGGGSIVSINGTTFINASICTEQYQPSNKPKIGRA